MKTRTALALVLASLATAACATSDDVHGGSGQKLDIENRGSVIEGRLVEDGIAIDFRIERRDSSRFTITGHDGFTLVDSTHGNAIDSTTILETFSPTDGVAMHDLSALPEAVVIRDLPHALAVRGIDISDLVETSPALHDILCPVRPLMEPSVQSDSLDSESN